MSIIHFHGRELRFNAYKQNKTLRPGILHAFIMQRKLDLRPLAETNKGIWTSSGAIYTPVFDFALSSLSIEEYNSKQDCIISCQRHADGSNFAIIRIRSARICPVKLIWTTVDIINEYQALGS